MFTYKFTCELKYALPVQTLIPLAMVLAITQVLSKAQDSDYSTSYVRVKWPNDIYLGKAKIGGILVDSETSGSLIVMNIGVGVNVDNDMPTTCLNSVTKGLFTREVLLIHYLNAFEDLFVRLKTEGAAGLQALYEERWYHHNSQATYLPTGQSITLTHVNLFEGLVALFPDGQSRVIGNREEIKFLP
jgi:biotin--protein ligase